MGPFQRLIFVLMVMLVHAAPFFEVFYRLNWLTISMQYNSPERFLVIFVIDNFILTFLFAIIPSLYRIAPDIEIAKGITLTDKLRTQNEMLNNYVRTQDVPDLTFVHERYPEKNSKSGIVN